LRWRCFLVAAKKQTFTKSTGSRKLVATVIAPIWNWASAWKIACCAMTVFAINVRLIHARSIASSAETIFAKMQSAVGASVTVIAVPIRNLGKLSCLATTCNIAMKIRLAMYAVTASVAGLKK
jgi:hypothetical protein